MAPAPFWRVVLALALVAACAAPAWSWFDPAKPWKGHAFPERNCASCGVRGTYKQAKRAMAAAEGGLGLSMLAQRVLIIGVDGLGARYIEPSVKPANVSLPNLDALRAQGAWTFWARSAMPTISKPNWMGIISSAGPEETGVLDNDWVVGSEWEPVTGNNTYFPSVFQAIADQQFVRPLRTAALTDWNGFLDLFPNPIVPHIYLQPTAANCSVMVNETINSIIRPDAADFTFLHFDEVDDSGHCCGWGSQAYYAAVMHVDSCIGALLAALDAAGVRNETLVIVTADHGGFNYSHGSTDAWNMYTPLIFSGPNVVRNYSIPCPMLGRSCYAPNALNVRNLDVAATALFALGLEVPDLWIGRPLVEIYTRR